MTDNPTFHITQNDTSLTIILCSDMDNIDKASNLTKKFLEDRGLSTLAFDVCLVLREGLSNAVRHAHQLDPKKMIHYILQIREDELTIEIEDQGVGFDWQKAMKQMAGMEHGPLREHGRGFKIMNKYFSEFTYNDKGNKLFLKKKVP